MRLLFLLLLVMPAAVYSQLPPIEPGVSQELARWRSVQYSNISYKLDLTLERMSPVLKGSIEIHVTQAASACAEPNCPPLYLILDWRKLPGNEKDSTVSNVKLNGTNVQSASFSLSQRSLDSTQERDKSRTLNFSETNDHLIFHDGVRMGENVITLDFTSPILTSGSAITRYIDKEDGSEYIYSLFVPSDASTAFPVFDQPDLKARFTLTVDTPLDWKVVTNVNQTVFTRTGPYAHPEISRIYAADETQPISTYVFAFAAGPWTQVSEPPASAGGVTPAAGPTFGSQPNRGTAAAVVPPANAGGSDTLRTSIYVRRSQAAKFQPHAAETFRLTREAIKYLETYFDYKFPWPKYDLVLIPEFPFGGMEHAGATFLKESSVIFPAEPTKGDYISRANVIFHETAHQWFGDLVTMRWFDDLWLKEGFAEFMAYKTLEHVMPEANAWKVFYERNKQAAYATDSTRGTTPIYQPIANLSAAKSAYGNIVYRKAPSFLRQAEFYLGEDKFQTAVRAFLKKHEYANAGWEDLVGEFEKASGKDLKAWGATWVKEPGLPTILSGRDDLSVYVNGLGGGHESDLQLFVRQQDRLWRDVRWPQALRVLLIGQSGEREIRNVVITNEYLPIERIDFGSRKAKEPLLLFPNYGDYGYGIFLLDDKSRDYVLKHIGEEKDPFLRSMMWGALWDSVREAEMDPREYVELVIRQLPTEPDETTTASLLGRVSTALNYYMPDAERVRSPHVSKGSTLNRDCIEPSLTCGLRTRLESILLDRMQHAETAGQRITFYRAFVSNATTEHGRTVLKQMLAQSMRPQVSEPGTVVTGSAARTQDKARSSTQTKTPLGAKNPVTTVPGSDTRATPILRTKDRFDIVTRLIILGDPDAPKLLTDLAKTETSDDAKRYAYAAHAAFPTAENRAKFWNDFVNNKDISESWIEAAIGPFNSIRHPELSQPYLERALAELPNLKRTRKIFFVNNWLSAWLGGQRDQAALDIVNKFLADNSNLDNDLRLKVLENVDVIERAVKIRKKFLGN